VGKRAVYPGMFDPMHNGHLDLIERSLRIFDELIVAVVANPSKEPLFTVKERLELIDECTAGIGMSRMRITSFDGLLIDLVDREGADCIVRGLRAVSDFEYEFQLANMNRNLLPDFESVFVMTGEDYFFVSARLVREVATFGGDVSAFVPANVLEALRKKLKR
jgi:pantetheine-phosphate adenylyltransferase